ncbi:MAG TPA: class II fructose-bisphosphate aldolase [Longimicrobiales bacterium]|nr:class II fructose-bisphosphate aldolase [Longimicrobiales bacterium]
MIVTTGELYRHAYGEYALGAYNANNVEQVLGLFEGNRRASAPFIVQISKGARKYAGARTLDAILRAAHERFPELVFAVHLDHGDEKTCYDAIDSGAYTSVMIDASHTPFEENVATTRRVVERAHERGVSVEAELGRLGGVEEHIAVDEKHALLTDPAEAEEFVRATGCDSLAVAVGTSHGAYKFSGTHGLHLDRIRAIQERLRGFPLVLHGASAVPAEEVRRINAAGGALDESARGVDLSDLPRAIPLGITKVNIDTDGRLVWTRVHREYFRDHPADFDLRKPGLQFMEALAEMVEERSGHLHSAGRLDGLREALARGR